MRRFRSGGHISTPNIILKRRAENWALSSVQVLFPIWKNFHRTLVQCGETEFKKPMLYVWS